MTDRPAFEITEEMERAVLEELRDYRLGDDLTELARRLCVAVTLECCEPPQREP